MIVARAAGRRVGAAGAGAGGGPGIGAGPAARRNGQAGQVPVQGREDDAAAGAAASAAVVVGRGPGQAVRGDRARTGDVADPDHHDPAAGCAARHDAGAVVARAGAAAAAHDDLRRRGGEDLAAVAADVETAVPGEPALAARAAVGPAAAAGVLVVGGRVPVRSAAAGVAGRAPGHAAGDAGALVGIVRPGVENRGARRVVDPARHAGSSFALRGVVVGARIRDVVGVGPASAGELTGAAAPQAESIDADGGPSEGERSGHVDREDAAGRAVPGCRRESRGQRGRAVLRHPDHLEPAHAVRAVVGVAGGVAVQETVSGPGGEQVERPAADADRVGGHDVLVPAGVAQVRVAARVPGGAAAVGAGVRRIDVRVLHLDDEEEVARGDGRRGAPRGAQGDRRAAGRGRGRRRPVAVDDARDAGGGAVPARRGAVDRGFAGKGREEKKESEKRPQPGQPPGMRPPQRPPTANLKCCRSVSGL